jgi:hypothetical protein
MVSAPRCVPGARRRDGSGSLGRGHREPCLSKRVRKSASTDAAIGKALKNGDIGIREIATTLRVDTGTVQLIKAKNSA